MWTTVIFIDENSVEVVPVSWLLENQYSCYWPEKAIGINTKIITCESPDITKWSVYRVRFPKNVMKTYSDYLKAREVANRVAENSEFSSSTDNENPKRKSKKKIISSSESESESVEENCVPFPAYSKNKNVEVKRGKKEKKSYRTNQDLVDNFNTTVTDKQTNSSLNNVVVRQPVSVYNKAKNDELQKERKEKMTYISDHDSSDNFETTFTEEQSDNGFNNVLVRELVRQMATMNTKLELIQQDITTLLTQRKSESSTNKLIEEISKYLPLKTANDVKTFEKFLGSHENFKQFTEYISHIGGYHLADITQRALTRVLSNSVGSMYSWAGRKGKDSFQKLEISRGILDGLSKNPLIKTKHTEKEVETSITNWLRHAPERFKREQK